MKKKFDRKNQKRKKKCFYFAKKNCAEHEQKITRNVPILFSSLKQKK